MPLGKTGTHYAKAMNKLGWHWWPSDTTIATTDYEGRAQLHQPRPLHAGLRAGRQGQHRHHLLAARASAPASSCARAAGCARSPPTSTAWRPARSTTTPTGKEQFQPAEVVIVACNGVGTPRLLLNSASAQFPNGLANSSRPGRQEPDAASLADDLGLCRGAARRRARAHHLPVEQGVLRDRPQRAASCAATRCSSTAASGRRTRRSPAPRPASCRGARDHHRVYRELFEHASASASPARTCRRSTTASRSIRC